MVRGEVSCLESGLSATSSGLSCEASWSCKGGMGWLAGRLAGLLLSTLRLVLQCGCPRWLDGLSAPRLGWAVHAGWLEGRS